MVFNSPARGTKTDRAKTICIFCNDIINNTPMRCYAHWHKLTESSVNESVSFWLRYSKYKRVKSLLFSWRKSNKTSDLLANKNDTFCLLSFRIRSNNPVLPALSCDERLSSSNYDSTAFAREYKHDEEKLWGATADVTFSKFDKSLLAHRSLSWIDIISAAAPPNNGMFSLPPFQPFIRPRE